MRGAKLFLSMLIVEVYSVVSGVAVLGLRRLRNQLDVVAHAQVQRQIGARLPGVFDRNPSKSLSQKSSLPTCGDRVGDLRECGQVPARQAVAQIDPGHVGDPVVERRLRCAVIGVDAAALEQVDHHLVDQIDVEAGFEGVRAVRSWKERR